MLLSGSGVPGNSNRITIGIGQSRKLWTFTSSRAVMANAREGKSFQFPKAYRYPPIWSLQPTLSTREAQFRHWSEMILSYCQYYRMWRLTLVEALDTPLFYNHNLRRRLSLAEAREIVDFMTRQDGAGRAEWIGDSGQKGTCWIYWKRPEEWAETIYKWVEDTGQKNTVLTLYELTEGESTMSQDFYGMNSEILQKTLQALAKRGKGQIFGSEYQQGMKFF